MNPLGEATLGDSKRKKNKWRRPRNLLQSYEENLESSGLMEAKEGKFFPQRGNSPG